MKLFSKSLVLLIIFNVFISHGFSDANQSLFKKLLERKQTILDEKKLSIDLDCDVMHVEQTKEACVEAFLPRALGTGVPFSFELVVKDDARPPEETRRLLECYWDDKCQGVIKHAQLGDPVFLHVVKNSDDKIAAFALFYLGIDQTQVYLDYIATHPDYQGCGLGALMIYSIFEKHPEAKEIFLRTFRAENEAGIGFYEYLGFTRVFQTDEDIYFRFKRD